MILGGLLGDIHCRIKKPKSINANIEWVHGNNQLEYSYWKSILLKRLQFNIRKTKLNTLHFASKNFKCLNYYHCLFYSNARKIINKQILNKLDKFGLLIWYLDDGSYHKRDKTAKLYTNCFTLFEQKLMQKWFKNKWGIKCNIQRAREAEYVLYFPASETRKLISLLMEFDIPECMKYKFQN